MPGVDWRGVRVSTQTRDMLEEMERISGVRINPSQGSWSGVEASAGTHSGAGAIDISDNGLSIRQVYALVRAGRTVGFAMYYRLTSEGFDSSHIHGISIDEPGLSPSAARQVASYRNGRNALKTNLADPQAWMGVKPRTWAQYKASLAPAFPLPWSDIYLSQRQYLGQRNGDKLSLAGRIQDGVTRALYRGAIGNVQRMLYLVPTGRFREVDADAVANYQRKHGITKDPLGRVGLATWRSLWRNRGFLVID